MNADLQYLKKKKIMLFKKKYKIRETGVNLRISEAIRVLLKIPEDK